MRARQARNAEHRTRPFGNRHASAAGRQAAAILSQKWALKAGRKTAARGRPRSGHKHRRGTHYGSLFCGRKLASIFGHVFLAGATQNGPMTRPVLPKTSGSVSETPLGASRTPALWILQRGPLNAALRSPLKHHSGPRPGQTRPQMGLRLVWSLIYSNNKLARFLSEWAVSPRQGARIGLRLDFADLRLRNSFGASLAAQPGTQTLFFEGPTSV